MTHRERAEVPAEESPDRLELSVTSTTYVSLLRSPRVREARTGLLESMRMPSRRFVALGLAPAIAIAFSTASAQEVRWRVSEAPTLAIGSTEGIEPMYAFHEIRGVGVVADSLILVADGGSNQLRIFSRDGRFLRSFGGKGDGPEEFRSIAWAEVCDGAIVAYDFSRQRATVWNAEGRLLEEFQVQGTRADLPPYAVRCGADRTFAVLGWPDVGASRVPVGPYRPEVAVGLADRQGQLLKVLATVPGPERYRYPTNDGPRRLGKNTIVRMGADVVYVGTADSFRVHVLSPDGGDRTFGEPFEPVPFTGHMRERWESDIVRRTRPELRPAARRALRALEMPDFLPAYADLRLDVSGFVWVERFPIPGEDGHGERWDVFDPDGTFAASVKMPNGFSPSEIGQDYVLGVGTDEDGVQRVQFHVLDRSVGPGSD